MARWGFDCTSSPAHHSPLTSPFLPRQVVDASKREGQPFAFICMDSPAAATTAKQELDGQNLGGRALRIRWAIGGAKQVWVGNLPDTVDNVQLALAFGQFGDVERAVVAATQNGSSAGYGFVNFRARVTWCAREQHEREHEREHD
jgi:hypothetical protein